MGGQPILFQIHLEKDLGVREARKLRDELIRNSNKPKRLYLEDFLEIEEDFKRRTKEYGCDR
jgi:hypothetical protein